MLSRRRKARRRKAPLFCLAVMAVLATLLSVAPSAAAQAQVRTDGLDCAVGMLTPDQTRCYVPSQSRAVPPLASAEVIDATFAPNPPTVSCPTGYIIKLARLVCSATVAVPDSVTGLITPPPVTTYSCTDGGELVVVGNANVCITPAVTDFVPGVYVPGTAPIPAIPAVPPLCPARYTFNVENDVLVCFHQLPGSSTECPPAAGLDTSNAVFHADGTAKGYCTAQVIPGASGVPEIPGVPPTCDGLPTPDPHSACGTTTIITPEVIVAATATTTQQDPYCPEDSYPKANGLCSTINPSIDVEIPATVTANPDTAVCPEGYDGPNSDNQCVRRILVMQPDQPFCEVGSLVDTGADLICLLDDPLVEVRSNLEWGCPQDLEVFTQTNGSPALSCIDLVDTADQCPVGTFFGSYGDQFACDIFDSYLTLAPPTALFPPLFTESECGGFVTSRGWVGGPSGDRCYLLLDTGMLASEPIVVATATMCWDLPVTVDLASGQLPTSGNDVILGTEGPDVIAGGDGDDVICGRGGDDVIWGQGGADFIVGGDGNDRLRGGAGDDTIIGAAGADDLNGGPGNDYVAGESGDDPFVRGGTGDDTVSGGRGADGLVAGNGGQDEVYGDKGDDSLVTGGPRPDFVIGGDGDDLLKGNKGADTLLGWYGDDDLRGGPQPDLLDGGYGTDSCDGGTEDDQSIDCETTSNVEAAFVPGPSGRSSLASFLAPPAPPSPNR